MPGSHPLGEYLRARRELLQPEDVGLVSGPGHRRVNGLRRSEVAAVAGISTEYYIKLEQGQETRPTDQVLNALSRALRLDANASSYLHALARAVSKAAHPIPAPTAERARWLIDAWPMTPALILDRHSDIVGVNAIMSALVDAYRVGRNATVALLTDPRMPELYVDWEGLSMRTIGLFRSRVGLYPDDPRTAEIIQDLTRDSPRFRELWSRHDIAGMTEGTHPMMHPSVGALTLLYAHLPLVGSDDHSIFLYYAEPGTRSEQALAELAGSPEGGSGTTRHDSDTPSGG